MAAGVGSPVCAAAVPPAGRPAALPRPAAVAALASSAPGAVRSPGALWGAASPAQGPAGPPAQVFRALRRAGGGCRRSFLPRFARNHGKGKALLLILGVCILWWRGATTTIPRGLQSDGFSAILQMVDAAAVQSGYTPHGGNNIAIWRVAFRCCITGTRLFLRAAGLFGRGPVIIHCPVSLPCRGCTRKVQRVLTARFGGAHAENPPGGRFCAPRQPREPSGI